MLKLRTITFEGRELELGPTTTDRYCGDCPRRAPVFHQCLVFGINLGLGPEGALRTPACISNEDTDR